MKKFKKRTRLFISKKFQVKYISLIVFFVFAAALLAGYTVYVTTWAMFGEKLAAVYPQGLLLDIVEKVNLVLFLRLVFLLPFIIMIGLVLSNRIAGPIYSIQGFLRKISEGSYESRLKLRKKDELQDLAVSLNALAMKLCSEKDEYLKKLESLNAKTRKLQEEIAAGKNTKEELLSKVSELRKEVGVVAD